MPVAAPNRREIWTTTCPFEAVVPAPAAAAAGAFGHHGGVLTIPAVTLNDGHSFAELGLGTYNLRGEEGIEAIVSAIASGYRLLDTAVNYENEREVGEVISADLASDQHESGDFKQRQDKKDQRNQRGMPSVGDCVCRAPWLAHRVIHRYGERLFE